ALDKMNDLLNLRKAVDFEKKTPHDIFRSLIGDAGLSSGTVTNGPSLPRYNLDSKLSAFAHLKELANRLGFELYANVQGKVMFHSPADAPGIATVSFSYGKQLLEAAVREADPAWGTITVGAESPMSSKGDKSAHWLTKADKDFERFAGTGKPKLLI